LATRRDVVLRVVRDTRVFFVLARTGARRRRLVLATNAILEGRFLRRAETEDVIQGRPRVLGGERRGGELGYVHRGGHAVDVKVRARV
jgi:hypothetical protein